MSKIGKTLRKIVTGSLIGATAVGGCATNKISSKYPEHFPEGTKVYTIARELADKPFLLDSDLTLREMAGPYGTDTLAQTFSIPDSVANCLRYNGYQIDVRNYFQFGSDAVVKGPQMFPYQFIEEEKKSILQNKWFWTGTGIAVGALGYFIADELNDNHGHKHKEPEQEVYGGRTDEGSTGTVQGGRSDGNSGSMGGGRTTQ